MQTDNKSNPLGWVSLGAVLAGVICLAIALGEDKMPLVFAFVAFQIVAVVSGLVARRSAPGKAGVILGVSFAVLSVLASGFFMTGRSSGDDGPVAVDASPAP